MDGDSGGYSRMTPFGEMPVMATAAPEASAAPATAATDAPPKPRSRVPPLAQSVQSLRGLAEAQAARRAAAARAAERAAAPPGRTRVQPIGIMPPASAAASRSAAGLPFFHASLTAHHRPVPSSRAAAPSAPAPAPAAVAAPRLAWPLAASQPKKRVEFALHHEEFTIHPHEDPTPGSSRRSSPAPSWPEPSPAPAPTPAPSMGSLMAHSLPDPFHPGADPRSPARSQESAAALVASASATPEGSDEGEPSHGSDLSLGFEPPSTYDGVAFWSDRAVGPVSHMTARGLLPARIAIAAAARSALLAHLRVAGDAGAGGLVGHLIGQRRLPTFVDAAPAPAAGTARAAPRVSRQIEDAIEAYMSSHDATNHLIGTISAITSAAAARPGEVLSPLAVPVILLPRAPASGSDPRTPSTSAPRIAAEAAQQANQAAWAAAVREIGALLAEPSATPAPAAAAEVRRAVAQAVTTVAVLQPDASSAGWTLRYVALASGPPFQLKPVPAVPLAPSLRSLLDRRPPHSSRTALAATQPVGAVKFDRTRLLHVDTLEAAVGPAAEAARGRAAGLCWYHAVPVAAVVHDATAGLGVPASDYAWLSQWCATRASSRDRKRPFLHVAVAPAAAALGLAAVVHQVERIGPPVTRYACAVLPMHAASTELVDGVLIFCERRDVLTLFGMTEPTASAPANAWPSLPSAATAASALPSTATATATATSRYDQPLHREVLDAQANGSGASDAAPPSTRPRDSEASAARTPIATPSGKSPFTVPNSTPPPPAASPSGPPSLMTMSPTPTGGKDPLASLGASLATLQNALPHHPGFSLQTPTHAPPSDDAPRHPLAPSGAADAPLDLVAQANAVQQQLRDQQKQQSMMLALMQQHIELMARLIPAQTAAAAAAAVSAVPTTTAPSVPTAAMTTATAATTTEETATATSPLLPAPFAGRALPRVQMCETGTNTSFLVPASRDAASTPRADPVAAAAKHTLCDAGTNTTFVFPAASGIASAATMVAAAGVPMAPAVPRTEGPTFLIGPPSGGDLLLADLSRIPDAHGHDHDHDDCHDDGHGHSHAPLSSDGQDTARSHALASPSPLSRHATPHLRDPRSPGDVAHHAATAGDREASASQDDAYGMASFGSGDDGQDAPAPGARADAPTLPAGDGRRADPPASDGGGEDAAVAMASADDADAGSEDPADAGNADASIQAAHWIVRHVGHADQSFVWARTSTSRQPSTARTTAAASPAYAEAKPSADAAPAAAASHPFASSGRIFTDQLRQSLSQRPPPPPLPAPSQAFSTAAPTAETTPYPITGLGAMLDGISLSAMGTESGVAATPRKASSAAARTALAALAAATASRTASATTTTPTTASRTPSPPMPVDACNMTAQPTSNGSTLLHALGTETGEGPSLMTLAYLNRYHLL
ncbi:hypothetical protein CXG81DRAFT_26550 [Caulochytrium protostelioides]|uniref:Uncharacterized protein n=1 Tax=Caulochytrium protostelioides TaxID=1555241 RepID=A0A4P9X6F3_9FUNG|nr:hypothetical protein CXG81DRAFT_26550 [Caulochytrium protostelioides]|eukprot:RKP00766.1 hypothetical protein CXG81DRAFT_26550 [Caulochytrium protostelioides]